MLTAGWALARPDHPRRILADGMHRGVTSTAELQIENAIAGGANDVFDAEWDDVVNPTTWTLVVWTLGEKDNLGSA